MSLNLDGEMTNFKDFRTEVIKHGFSINNFYDVIFEISGGTALGKQLSQYRSVNLNDTTFLMRLYTDELSLPGLQMSTGEYRITNTPTLKYVYGSVFSEVQFSFIMDADAEIKSVFDLWTNWMYSYTLERESIGDTPFVSSRQDRFRTSYRDDYATDIMIIKYERAESSDKNKGRDPFTLGHIIPDISTPKQNSKFYKAIPTYAVKLFKAFPANISSVPLNSGTSELSKLSVGFEYETYSTTALTDGDVGAFFDSVNQGSSSSIDIASLFSGLV
tara:strand:- start:185 stop:1006 length:822 start_codon:yes stop_codon:yes gene_type:complete